MKIDSNFWVYQTEDGWEIEAFHYETDKSKGVVECQSLAEVAQALLDVSVEETNIMINPGEN